MRATHAPHRPPEGSCSTPRGGEAAQDAIPASWRPSRSQSGPSFGFSSVLSSASATDQRIGAQTPGRVHTLPPSPKTTSDLGHEVLDVARITGRLDFAERLLARFRD